VAAATVESDVETIVGTATTSHTITYPATITAGATILVCNCFDDDNNNATYPASGPAFTRFVNRESNAGNDSTLACAWAEADGTEDGGTFDVTVTGLERSTAVCYSILGADPDTSPPEAGSTDIGNTSTNADPLTVTPSGGSDDYLYFAFASVDEAANTTAYPSGYTNTGTAEAGAGNTSTLYAQKATTASTSDNPGTFTHDNKKWISVAVAVYPPVAGGDISLTSDPGSLVLTGAAATTLQTLAADPGALLLTGSEATLQVSAIVQADPGALQLAGANAALAIGLSSEPGALLFTGADADLLADKLFEADPGALILSGAEATLQVSAIVQADPGAVLLTGAEADLSQTVLIARRGGVRWLYEENPEKREEKKQELKSLVKPAFERESSASAPQGRQDTKIQRVANAAAKMTPAEQTRTERLLQETGITLEELLIIIE